MPTVLVAQQHLLATHPYATACSRKPCHPARKVLSQTLSYLIFCDRNHDGKFTLDKIKRFAQGAYKQTQQLSIRDPAYMIQGSCTLSMWYFLQQPDGKQKFVDW